MSIISFLLITNVHRDGRAEGSLGPPPVLASVNLVPLLWTGVPTPSTPVDRQDPLPILRCPGNASTLVLGAALGSSLITSDQVSK